MATDKGKDKKVDKTLKERKKPGPMHKAAPTDKAWIPGVGEITVAQLGELMKSKRAEQKQKVMPESLTREALTNLSALEAVPTVKGTFTSAMFKKVSAAMKEAHKRKTGISRGSLLKVGYVDRHKQEGFAPIFFITPAGKAFMDSAPTVVAEAPAGAAEAALASLAEPAK